MNFSRTAIDAEKQTKKTRFENDVKYCKDELFNSATHLLISFEKLLDSLPNEIIEANTEHIDNVYYHIGKLKGLS